MAERHPKHAGELQVGLGGSTVGCQDLSGCPDTPNPNLGFQMYNLKVVFQNRGTPCVPQNTLIFIMGTPKRVPLILGNPHVRFSKLPSIAGHPRV